MEAREASSLLDFLHYTVPFPTALPASKNLSKTVHGASAINSCLLRQESQDTQWDFDERKNVSLKAHDKQSPKELFIFIFPFFFFLLVQCQLPYFINLNSSRNF